MSTSHVPFSQALSPATSAVVRGQIASAAAAPRPTTRRPVAYQPAYAVATSATTFAASDSGKPNANAIS